MSPSPTVSRDSSAKRSASSRRPWSSSTCASSRWLSTTVPRSWIGLSSADRLAQDLLGARGGRACSQSTTPSQFSVRASVRRRAALGEERSRLVERGLGVVEPALDGGLPAGRAQDPGRASSGSRSSPASSIARASGSWRALGLEPRVVDVVELEQHAALEVGAPDPLRDREPLVREPLDLLEVALPVRDRADAPRARRTGPRRRPPRRRRAP